MSHLDRIRGWGDEFDVFELGIHGVEDDGTWWILLRADEVEVMAFQWPGDPRIEFLLRLVLDDQLLRDPRLGRALQELEERRPALFWHRFGNEGEVEVRWRIWEDGLTRHALNVAVLELAEAYRVLTGALERLRSQRHSESSLLDMVRSMGPGPAVVPDPVAQQGLEGEPVRESDEAPLEDEVPVESPSWGPSPEPESPPTTWPEPPPAFGYAAYAAPGPRQPEAPAFDPFAGKQPEPGFMGNLSATHVVASKDAQELRRKLFRMPEASPAAPAACAACAGPLLPGARFCAGCGAPV